MKSPLKRKKRKKSTKNYYFTQVHEDAIVKYANTEDRKLKSVLYIEYIQPAFDQMVDKIIYTYRFTTLPNIDSLKDECKIWLTTILNKYDPNKGSKAFSYFSVVTKNWFIHKVKKTQKQNRTEVYLEDVINQVDEDLVSREPTYESKRENIEFWASFGTEMTTWDSFMLKENEKKVLTAVRILLDSADQIEIFNKKAIYLYLREITGLNTKQVVNNLNKLRKRYKVFKEKWESGQI
jgi:DNA-directed RNA polymerase specialized sigma subunit